MKTQFGTNLKAAIDLLDAVDGVDGPTRIEREAVSQATNTLRRVLGSMTTREKEGSNEPS